MLITSFERYVCTHNHTVTHHCVVGLGLQQLNNSRNGESTVSMCRVRCRPIRAVPTADPTALAFPLASSYLGRSRRFHLGFPLPLHFFFIPFFYYFHNPPGFHVKLLPRSLVGFFLSLFSHFLLVGSPGGGGFRYQSPWPVFQANKSCSDQKNQFLGASAARLLENECRLRCPQDAREQIEHP